MKYWKVTCSNGFCGCDEEFYFEEENEDKAYLMGQYFLEDDYGFYDPDERFVNLEDKEEVEDYYAGLEYQVDEISKEEYDEAMADYL